MSSYGYGAYGYGGGSGITNPATYSDPALGSAPLTSGTAAALGQAGYADPSAPSTGSGSSNGWFGSLFNNLTSTPQGAAALGSAGANVAGALIGGVVNQGAAKTAGQGMEQAAAIQAAANLQAEQEILAAQEQARQEYAAAAQKGINYIQQGVTNYQGTIEPLLTPAPITLPSYRGMTQQQQTGEQDLLRTGNAQLASSGLRGAGRAGVGAVLDQDRRYHEDIASQNDQTDLAARQQAQQTANQARTNLAGIQAQAGGSEANTELLQGNQLGNSYATGGTQVAGLQSQTGAAQGAATASAAQDTAAAGLATGNLAAGTVGAVSSALTNPYLTGGAGTPNSPGLVNAGTGYTDPASA